MKNIFYFLVLLFGSQFLNAQVLTKDDKIKARQDQRISDTIKGSSRSTSNKNIKNKEATIELYKIISYDRDTTLVDTSLSIKKEYKFNYLRKDNFELISFSNLGQTYNTLSKDFKSSNTLPLFAARARHFNYMEVEDVNYYQVPTPLTELLYKSAFEQGQVLDAFFTVNTSKQFNFSIAYKGLRSLGKYQNILTSTGNFRFTSNYISKNKNYQARAQIVMQDLLNQENGGLKDIDIQNFESGNTEFLDRSVFEPNFEDAENVLIGKRFYLDHEYIISKGDSIKSNELRVGNIISFEDKYYQFKQNAKNTYFGEAFRSTGLSDKVKLENFYNRVYLNLQNKSLGQLKLNLDYHNFNYGYNAIVFLNDQIIKNRIKGNVVTVGGFYDKSVGNLDFTAEFGFNVSSEFKGDFINASSKYKINSNTTIGASIHSNSKAANYNQLLYQSDYLNYNWDNSSVFRNIKTQQFAFQLLSNKIANLTVDYTNISNFTYFKKLEESNLIKPVQEDDAVNYFRLKLSKEIKRGKFALDNTILYQKVIQGEAALNMPQILTRNTLYYSNNFFKKALYLQTGITFNYFSKYNMNGYDPLLAEFYTQNNQKIGGFPRLDFFVNAKIRQTRIYLKAEHFNSAFTGYNYYSAPNYPYRDFSVRFGIEWNFFL